jgi:asparagine synthase (glutamine-hydrolysing)
MARRHVTVSLSGDGGDEVFAGYTRYLRLDRAWGRMARVPPCLRPVLGRVTGPAPAAAMHRAVTAAGMIGRVPRLEHRIERLSRLVAASGADAFCDELVSLWISPGTVVNGASDRPARFLTSEGIGLNGGITLVERSMLADMGSYLPDDIMVKVDRAAMAVSLESRAPFLDHRVVNLAWRIPLTQKLRDGRGKDILRRVLVRYVPRELIERKKQGFSIPVGQWIRGPLRDWAETLLASTALADGSLLRPAPIRRRWKEHLAGDQDWSDLLWPVLMFQGWRHAQDDRSETRN